MIIVITLTVSNTMHKVHKATIDLSDLKFTTLSNIPTLPAGLQLVSDYLYCLAVGQHWNVAQISFDGSVVSISSDYYGWLVYPDTVQEVA